MAERQEVYNAKVSIRSNLQYLQTIRSRLKSDANRLSIFTRSVFGPWLDIKTIQHDNLLLNFLLQHQRYVDTPSPEQPFIFDIDGRTFEYGREDFCIITGFRFGKYKLNPKEEDKSDFRKRVFPNVPHLKGADLLKIIEDDSKFSALNDEDAVRVCLLLALDYVFMGYEFRHVISNAVVNMVDDLNKWDEFPWGEYFWRKFHEKVYNVALVRRKYHLEKMATNPKYEASFVLYGFVFPFKIWALETFSNSSHWWRKVDGVIPRGVAWCNVTKFDNSCFDRLFYSDHSSCNKITPSPVELNQSWWLSSLEFFESDIPSTPLPSSSTRVGRGSRVVHRSVLTEVRREVRVLTVERIVEKQDVSSIAVDQSELVERAELIKTVKAQEQTIEELKRRLGSVEKVTKKLRTCPDDVDEATQVNDNEFIKDHECNGEHQSLEDVSQCMSLDGNADVCVDGNAGDCVDNVFNDEFEGLSQCGVGGFDGFDLDGMDGIFNSNQKKDLFAVGTLISLRSSDSVTHTSQGYFVDEHGLEINENSDVMDLNDKTEVLQSPVTTQNIREMVDELEYQDGVAGLVDLNQNSLVDKLPDDDQTPINTVDHPLDRKKYPSKVYCSPYVQLPSTDYKIKKPADQLKMTKAEPEFKMCLDHNGNTHKIFPWIEDLSRSPNAPKKSVAVPEAISSFFRDKHRTQMKWTFPWADGFVVYFEFWEKLVGRGYTKRGWLSDNHLDVWIDYLWLFRDPTEDWVMASPYLFDMLNRFECPRYYGNGYKYGVPWSQPNVEKVYFPINEKDNHWVLGELDIYSGMVTIYDTLRPSEHEIRTSKFWKDTKKTLEVQLPSYMDEIEVFEKKNIDRKAYRIGFRFADGVPKQGGSYGDCGLWVCIMLYRLSHRIPLPVDDHLDFALAYRERMIDFFWSYKILYTDPVPTD